ncbi:MAG: DUF2807 domain-containing protein [Erythrobacter sp.]
MIGRIFKRVAPAAMLAVGLASCGSMDVTINGEEGVPLSELDLSGEAPTEVVVATNATVVVTEGDTLTVTVENDDEDALRFVRDGAVFGVTSDPDLKIRNGQAIVNVTMPAPTDIVIAGSGSVRSATVAQNADLAIGGSGSIAVESIETESLSISIGGSGSVTGAGTTDTLDISIGGSGDVDMPGLNANTASIGIGGAGDVQFASDGEVDASIAGSGNIAVKGDATCTVSALGSGKLVCEPNEAAAEPTATEDADDGSDESADEGDENDDAAE